ncbi:hypothetical protein Agabi119p4_5477 [Agaricus bisporus var. burnettii]|uniref:Peptidase S9 prolyl oligopeptidase catalytic domain-containing protein n=1 Tax=Agaricus bisporus var. burnettii TaxID=192524 RepID=A0A8H7F1P3_AGABI|nr:hypothetical protein Agabi119p4_5477 [Agaricus bisporus var. burnettii]
MVQTEHYQVAGLIVNVYTVESLTHSNRPVIVLFFLHGRNGSAAKIEDMTKVILESSCNANNTYDLAIVTFDHRNHGSRVRDPNPNRGWSRNPEVSNERHALDMYAIQTGTAADVSFLIDFLPAYLFPTGKRSIKTWGVAGKSLGGHSAWLALGQDERISFGIPIIACPDYLKLMEKRASRFSLPIAPPYFPASLIELVRRRDPVMKAFDRVDDANPYLGKKVLVLSGGADKLVPWEASREFVEKLAVGPSGVKKVLVVEGVGHECTPEMLATAGQFVGEEILSD